MNTRMFKVYGFAVGLMALSLVGAGAAVGQAVVSTNLISGDPTLPNSSFQVEVVLSGNTQTVGSYAFAAVYDKTVMNITNATAGEFPGSPGFSGAGTGEARITLSDITSTFVNGRFFVLQCTTLSADPAPCLTITIQADGTTPLIATNFLSIAHSYDYSATTDMGVCVPVDTPTNTPVPPTDTPAPPTSTPTNTTVPPTNTPGPAKAQVSLVIDGDACEGQFVVEIHLAGNASGLAVGSYALEMTWPAGFTYQTRGQGDYPVNPGVNQPDATTLRLSATAFDTTFMNGVLATVTLSTTGDVEGEIAIGPFGSTPITLTNFNQLPVDYNAVDIVCDEEDMFRWGDMNDNNIAGTVDASLILQYDAFLIDSFPCCPETWPDFPPRGDVNGDGVLGTVDASLILQFDAFLIFCFPADTNCDGFGPESN